MGAAASGGGGGMPRLAALGFCVTWERCYTWEGRQAGWRQGGRAGDAAGRAGHAAGCLAVGGWRRRRGLGGGRREDLAAGAGRRRWSAAGRLCGRAGGGQGRECEAGVRCAGQGARGWAAWADSPASPSCAQVLAGWVSAGAPASDCSLPFRAKWCRCVASLPQEGRPVRIRAAGSRWGVAASRWETGGRQRSVDGRRVGDNGQSMGDGWETATRGSNDGRRMGDGGQSVSGLGRAGRAGAACPTLDHSGSNLHRGGPSGLGGWQSAPACPDRPCPAAPTRPWAGGRAGAPWTTSQAVWQLRFAESSKWGKSQPAHQSGPHPRPVRLQSGPALGGAQGPLLRPAHPGPFPRQERVTNRKNNG